MGVQLSQAGSLEKLSIYHWLASTLLVASAWACLHEASLGSLQGLHFNLCTLSQALLLSGGEGSVPCPRLGSTTVPHITEL